MLHSDFDWDSIPDGSIHCDDARKYFTVVNGRVLSPREEKLDIFSKTSKVIPEWKPTAQYKKYEELSMVIVDIETLRVDNKLKDIREKARHNRIMSIGIRNEQGVNIFIQDESESWMLQQFFETLERKQPDLIVGHNSMWFDMPFMIERAKILGIYCPFYINYNKPESRFAAAAIAGRFWNVAYRPVYTKLKTGKKVHHIDTMMCAISWDSVMRKLDSYRLKTLPVDLNLREEDDRLELTIDEIEECYRLGDWDTLHHYLGDDLSDTHLLANRFIPEIVNQQMFFPEFNIQQLATYGVGTKWSSATAPSYSAEYVSSLGMPEIYSYQGAYTFAIAGFHEDVIGGDFSGQYPDCQDRCGIASIRDPKFVMLSILRYAVQARNELKYKEENTGIKLTQAEEEHLTTVKPINNGCYGATGARIPFGDSIAAAMVTAFARARILWARKTVRELGGEVVLTDTDSVFIKTDRTDLHKIYEIPEIILKQLPPNASDKMLSAAAILSELRRLAPDGTKIDLDSVNRYLFVPPTTVASDYNKSYKVSHKTGQKFIKKTLGSDLAVDYLLARCPDSKVTFELLKEASDEFGLGFPDYDAILKNYIKLIYKKGKFVLVSKGRFKKRDRTHLEKQFQQRYVEFYADSPEKAEEHYKVTLAELMSGQFDIAKLTVHRKIRIKEKKLIQLGFGQERDEVSFYMGASGEYVQSGPYDIMYYVGKLNRMYHEIKDLMEHKLPDTLKDDN